MKKYALLLSMTLGFACHVQAITLWSNPITGTNPNTTNPYTTGDVVAANIAVSGIGRGAGINGANANDRYNASAWSTGGLDTLDYFTFTLTPSSGFQISFTDFVYTGQASTTGPTMFAFRSSLDGFTGNIGTPSVSGTTISLTGLQFQGLTGPIEFRFYAFGASAAGGTFSINGFTFNGSVDQVAGVPESSPGLAAFAFAVAMLALARNRILARGRC